MDIGRDMSLKRMWGLSLFPVALFPSCRQGMTTVAQPLKPVFVHVVNPPLEYPEFPESREKIKKLSQQQRQQLAISFILQIGNK